LGSVQKTVDLIIDRLQTFNSLYWVQRCEHQCPAECLDFFQFPLLGSLISQENFFSATKNIFQFPLLGSGGGGERERSGKV